MKKKWLAMLLALVLAFSLLPGAADAAEPDLPDWYFLFAIFKSVDADVVDGNGVRTHSAYTMTQEEVDVVKGNAAAFLTYMNGVGVMTAHVDVVEIDTPVTELTDSGYGSQLSPAQAYSLLKDAGIDPDDYDHVFCNFSLGVKTAYTGLTGAPYENGTGHSSINLENREYAQWVELYVKCREGVCVHEFLHFMEQMDKKWGETFDLHGIANTLYTRNEEYGQLPSYTDIILDRVNGDAGLGTGVAPAVWLYSPHVLRTISELTIPEGVTSIGHNAFYNCENLKSLTIPNTVTSIGERAFRGTGLTSVTLPGSVTSIDEGAFASSSLESVTISDGVISIGTSTFYNCVGLKSVSIPASVTSIRGFAFYGCSSLNNIYYGGTEEQWNQISVEGSNSALTKATIHYNRGAFSDVPANEWYADAVVWAVANGVTGGTGNGEFSPGQTCNQAQILTFLWRAEGEPNPAAAVSSTEYYAKAAQWAKEQGLTDTFVAEAPCTRAMAVTYLWKLVGSPVEGASSFSDVPASASYAQAVAWAVKNGVTSGTGDGTFSPEQTCTRAQIVTFLWRALGQ